MLINSYDDYDFICLLESIYTDKIHEYFKNKQLEVFLYGIHKDSSYKLEEIYLITDLVLID